MEMNKYYQQSKKILAENRVFLDKLIAALLEKKMLTRKEIQEIRNGQVVK
jgi:ATP-dependent Zn protease